ncbi:MAG TPA: LptE family protein [Flavobacteriaceae bacterium]|nr:LptE family protein [Flavobacteriaceae bacterium]
MIELKRDEGVKLVIGLLFIITLQSCGVYSFTGADTGEAETFQVRQFQNEADLVEPGIDRDFTLELQDLIQNQTNLGLTNEGGDLVYEGEIVQYYIAPMTATSDSRAAQNRLTIGVNVRFINKLDPEKDFERQFSFYYDYPGNQQLTGSTLETALNEIFEHITQEIFNSSLTNW